MLLRRQSARRGSVAAVVAVLLIAVIGILALAIDTGLMFEDRRKSQGVADAAALAAAASLYTNFYSINSAYQAAPTGPAVSTYVSAARSAALSVASTNGFANDGVDTTVTVNIPPTQSTYFTKTAIEARNSANGTSSNPYCYAEVIVTYRQPAAFARIWNAGPVWVQARAVARGEYGTSENGIIALDPTANDAVVANGNGSGDTSGDLRVEGASIIVNSRNSNAIGTNGAQAEIMDSMPVRVVGGWDSADNFRDLNGASIPPVKGGVAPDPYAYLPDLTSSGLTSQNVPGGPGPKTLQPGAYSGNITLNPAEGPITLAPGVYHFAGNLRVNTDISGNGVFIYGDNLDLSGAGTVNLSPMTSGTYKGITYFQNRSSSALANISGNASSNITGVIYNKNGGVALSGNGQASIASQVVAKTLTSNGNGRATIKYNAGTVAPTKIFGLCE